MQQHLPALSRTSGRQTFLLQKRHFCWILCKSSSSSGIMIIIIIIDIWSQLISGTNGRLWRHWGERRWKQCKNCECCPVSLLILNCHNAIIVLNSGSQLSEKFQEKNTSYLCYGLVFAFVFVIVFFWLVFERVLYMPLSLSLISM